MFWARDVVKAIKMSKAEVSIKDKSAVITGGATGIGYEIADNFLRKGAKIVALLDINPQTGAKAVMTLAAKYGPSKAIFLQCDIRNEPDMEQVFAKLLVSCKQIDVLVNNAGVLDDIDWKKCIDINVTYLIGWSLKFWEYMRKDRSGNGGTIINLSSIYGYRVAPFVPVYTASKFAVFGFTKSLGHQYHYNRTGVRVIALCPGFTNTPMIASSELNTMDDKQLNADYTAYLQSEAIWQTVDSVGNAALDIFEKSESGKTWCIEGGKPIFEV